MTSRAAWPHTSVRAARSGRRVQYTHIGAYASIIIELALLALLLPAVAHAQSNPLPVGGAAWVRVTAPGVDELWYDREKLVYSGNEVAFWRRVIFNVPQQFKTFQVRTALYREQINCDDHTMRVHAQVFQSVDGMMVEHVNYAAPESASIVPDTVGDALWRALCPMVAQRRALDERLRIAQERLDNRRRELDRVRAEVEDMEASIARLRTEARDPAREATRDFGRGSPLDSSRDQSRDPVRDQTREPSRDSARDTTREPIRDSTRDYMRDLPRQPGRQGL
ncbi:MAG: hypothetical protein H7125_15295 [Proteobacteria bacterium]|nr:hypothetical protein [Burkholderiales bacterium]